MTITDFQSIIGMSNVENGKYKMTLTFHSNYCDLLIYYINTLHTFDLVANNIAELPVDINRKINEYLPCYITLQLRIDYSSRNYPFLPPIWYMVSHNNYLACSLQNAEEYYNYIIANHNECNNANWSPVITIEKDILSFIVRINHFDSLY